MPSNFMDYAPQGPIKGNNQQWCVFLSYRSVSRPWVLRLYDALRHLQYDVFMDQYVLTTSESLTSQLEANLDASATGVLIWSHQSEDSVWCRREYNAFVDRESDRFRYIVVNVGGTELPTFARQKLWIDFSGSREGPTGTGMLRLLHGLHGKPLPPEAVRLAADFDDATRRAQASITAARASGDADALILMAHSTGLEWTTTSQLGCSAAEALIAIDRPADALALLDRAAAAFPRSIRPQQLRGLALARMSDWRGAQQVLGELEALGEKDTETLGLLARTWRDRYAQSGDPRHLRKARNLYAEAFASAPGDYYTGINAATNSVLLGDLETAAARAAEVEKIVGADIVPGDYWKSATVAEVQLLQGQYERAARLYRAAVDIEPEAKGHHESTRAQARRLMDKLQPDSAQRAAIEAAFVG